ncbi:TPA: ABC transporter ATP-binding protein [Streptococcus suis]|uniref:ABC transporter ATP-binding protein n=1 Tax=Streptococcus suis TaxID=1307 RepID=UPI001E48E40E|nr:ABC transporter ATP-binding protein [Streptococcus suis]MCB2937669.1 ABC transporter ATP-binding protein [Streptococcus suis]
MATEVKKIKVKIEEVSKSFQSIHGEVVALNQINLEIFENEIVTVVGPSGCGKSTLLNLVAGLEPVTSGKIYCDDNEIVGVERGVVFQQYALFPWMSVQQNVMFGPEMQGKSKLEASEIANKYIKMVGLQEFSNHYPKELSGGMKQRVAIARAYAVNPTILLMDEPFGALDAQTRIQLQDELIEMLEHERKTCLFITHDIEEAILLGNRVIIMSSRPGEIKEIVNVDLPFPRSQSIKFENDFIDIKNHIWSLVYKDFLNIKK